MDTNAIDEIKRLAEILSASKTERKAFIFMPTFKGFDVYEVSEPLAQHCISSEALKKSAESNSTDSSQSNIQDVSDSFCHCKVPDLYFDQEHKKEMCYKCKKLSAIDR